MYKILKSIRFVEEQIKSVQIHENTSKNIKNPIKLSVIMKHTYINWKTANQAEFYELQWKPTNIIEIIKPFKTLKNVCKHENLHIGNPTSQIDSELLTNASKP